LSDIGIQDIFADNGPIEELELDEDLERHLVERQHGVSFSEILGCSITVHSITRICQVGEHR